jgi:hypothetical protein
LTVIVTVEVAGGSGGGVFGGLETVSVTVSVPVLFAAEYVIEKVQHTPDD